MKKGDTKVKCRHCGSRHIQLSEIYSGHALIWEQFDGKIDLNDSVQEMGHPVKVEARCFKCNRAWTIRGAYQIHDVLNNP